MYKIATVAGPCEQITQGLADHGWHWRHINKVQSPLRALLCTETRLPTWTAGTRESCSSTASTLVATGLQRDPNWPYTYPRPSWRATVSQTRWSSSSTTKSSATRRRTGATAPSSSSPCPSSTGQFRFSSPRLLEDPQDELEAITTTTTLANWLYLWIDDNGANLFP